MQSRQTDLQCFMTRVNPQGRGVLIPLQRVEAQSGGWIFEPAVPINVPDRNKLLFVYVVQVPLEVLALQFLAQDLSVRYVADFRATLLVQNDRFRWQWRIDLRSVSR